MFPEEGIGFKWSPSRWHILAYADLDQPVAHLGFDAFPVATGDDREVTVIGVGGVVVRPEFQRQGIPRLLFDRLHHAEEARAVSDRFALFCPHWLSGYYEKLGYQPYQGRFTFLQDTVETATDRFAFMYRGGEFEPGSLRVLCHPW